MNRRPLHFYLSALAVGAMGLALACGVVSPYPGEDPTGPYKGGVQMGAPSGGGGIPEGGILTDGEILADGETEGGAAGVCTGCSLVATALDPQALALDKGNIYWTEGMNSGGVPVAGGGDVNSVARTGGGVPTPIAKSLTGPLLVAVLDPWIAWSADGTGAGMSLVSLIAVGASGPPSVPAMNQSNANGVALDSANVYWTSNDGSGNALVQSAPLSGGGISSLGSTTTAVTPLGMVVNADFIYFVGGSTLWQLPVTGGPVTAAWSGGSNLVGIAIDGSNVYFTDNGSGMVYSMPLGGGTVTTMATGIGGPYMIAVDSMNVYFTAHTDGMVYEEAKTGTTTATAIVPGGLIGPSGIAADDNDANVYFTDNTIIESHPKM
jgi:hypothetical protein